MRYGFAIDQRTCIGCHACTVACKTEHEIPVGQFRTWVKYVDSGEFPNSTRDFGVMRCNHCTDAPCVRICPTKALFTRDDGIVDFDSDRCIGCKSCLQGCPYDAIYLDEDTHTAAKCNFCAHRIDANLEPACVVVCPTHSIWVGDLDDPASGISKLITTNPVAVRAPEQHTGPNVFYLGADRAVLDPLAAPADGGYLYSTPDPHRAAVAAELPSDPISRARTTLNTAHPRPWGWRVTTYLWTKAVAAGAMLLAALARLLGIDLGSLGTLVAPAIGMAGVGITGVLLVWDLKRPERFLYIFLKPNLRSWLFWGSVALSVGAALFSAWLVVGILGAVGVLSAGVTGSILLGLAVPTLLAAVMTTGYTAFLFGQAEGRDLWQSPLLFWHLVVQACMVGAGALVIAALVYDVDTGARTLLVVTLTLATAVHVVMMLFEYLGRHPTSNAAAAAHLVVRGRY
ncbi:MAG: polysulfide reductase NrfD, partial [Actinobacteria bacterium]|nr:polysulfide reductase NrfD [Actinomycetota bacterium]